MNINLDSYRAIAGDDTSIGYAVLNSKGTGLEKADNHKTLTSRNITPLDSAANATARHLLFDLVNVHLQREQGANSELQNFLDSIAKELGIERKGNNLVISSKPLERRTIRNVFAAMDVFKAAANGNGDEQVKLTKKEQKVMDLFSKANFADDKSDPGDLMRLAAAVKRVKYGDTLAESVMVGGTKVTLAGDKVNGKIQIKALFGSGIVDVDLNGGFLEGALRKSFENPSKLPSQALQRNLARLEKMLDGQPLLSPVSVGVGRLARALIFSKFPKGLNAELFDQLSPRGMVQIARHAADGSYKTAANVNEAAHVRVGQYNSVTGDVRNPGKRNDLNQRIDQNINSAENDALVEKFLAMEDEKQQQVQFNEKVRVPARPSETMSNDEVNRVFIKYSIGFAKALAENENGEKKVEDGGQFPSGPLGEGDLAACEKLFDKDLDSDTDLSDIWLEVKGDQTITLEPKAEEKVEEKVDPNDFFAAFKKMAAGIKKQYDQTFNKEPKTFSVTTGSLKAMLANEMTRKTLVRIMCNAGENGAELEKLGKFAPHAKLLTEVMRGILENVKLGVDEKSGKEKTLLDLFAPGNESAALAALEKEIMPLHNAEGAAIKDLAAKAEDFTANDKIDCVSLMRNFGNSEKTMTTAARLLTMNLEGKPYPEEVKKLRNELLTAFGDLELERTEDDEPVLLKDACTMDKTSKIVDAIRGKVELEIDEKDVKAARLALADLLQDADTWEMDKRVDKPGERLKYSLDKNAAVFARLLCNPGHVKALGQPTGRVADMMLSQLKDKLMSDAMRAELRSGNEKTVEKLLLGMVRSPLLSTPIPKLGDKSILAAAEEMIETQAAVMSRQMQAVTSSMFTQMLSGGGVSVDADKIKDAFTRLSDVFGEINPDLDEVQCADEALKFIGELPAGRTVADFMGIYDATPEPAQGGVEARKTEALNLLKQLESHPNVKVDDLLGVRAVYEQNKVKAPPLTSILNDILLKMPKGRTVGDLKKVFSSVHAQMNAAAVSTESVKDQLDNALGVFFLDGASRFSASDLAGLIDLIGAQAPAEGEEPASLESLLKGMPKGRANAVNDFRMLFNANDIGGKSISRTLEKLAQLPASKDVAPVLEYMKAQNIDFDAAVDTVGKLPPSRQLEDVTTVVDTLKAAGIACESGEAMKTLSFFTQSAEDVARMLKAVIAEVGIGENGRPNNLSIEDAAKLTKFLLVKSPDSLLKMLDNFKFTLTEKLPENPPAAQVNPPAAQVNPPEGQVNPPAAQVNPPEVEEFAPATGPERLLLQILNRVSYECDTEFAAKSAVTKFQDLDAQINALLATSKENDKPVGDLLAEVVAMLPEPQPIAAGQEVKVEGKRVDFKEEKAANHGFLLSDVTFKPLNTPPFDPKSGGVPNLVQSLRMNGMNAEADEIDVEPEMAPDDPATVAFNYSTDEALAEFHAYKNKKVDEAKKALQKRRLELSRKLLDKMSASATDTSQGYGQFMCKVMNRYFGSLGNVDARTMLASACRYSDGGSPVQMLGAMLKGAGPIMHKMLQGLASVEGLPKEFLAALEDMRSNLTDIPQTVVRAQLNELIEQSNGLIEKIEIDKALGAASVAQTFFCKMTIKGESEPREVVVKMLRPDVQEHLEREKAIFRECAAEVPGMKVTFEGQLAGILEELDLRQEAKNVEVGQVYNKGEIDVSSMKLIPGVPILRNVMVVEKAPGTTADRLMKQMNEGIDAILKPFIDNGKNKGLEDGELSAAFKEGDVLGNARKLAEAQQKLIRMYQDALVQQKRLITLAEKWSNEGIYNGGFYHGDLHAGNIMLDPVLRDENGKVIEGSGAGGLTVIDFGNATQLTKDQQKAVMRMMMAATQGNSEIFIENFMALMTPEGRADFEQNRKTGKMLDRLVNGILNLGNEKDAEKRIFSILQQLMLNGYEMPAPVYKFSQCTLRLQGTISQMNAVLERTRQAVFELSRLNLANGIDPLNGFFNHWQTSDSLEYVDDVTRAHDLTSYLGTEKSVVDTLTNDIEKHVKDQHYQRKLGNGEKFELPMVAAMVNRYAVGYPDKAQALNDAFAEMIRKMGARNAENPLYVHALNLKNVKAAIESVEAEIAKKEAKEPNKEKLSDLEERLSKLETLKNLMPLWRTKGMKLLKGLRSKDNPLSTIRTANRVAMSENRMKDFDRIFDSFISLSVSNDMRSLRSLGDPKGIDAAIAGLKKEIEIRKKANKAYTSKFEEYGVEGNEIKPKPNDDEEHPNSQFTLAQLKTMRKDYETTYNNALNAFKDKIIKPFVNVMADLVVNDVFNEFKEKIGNGCEVEEKDDNSQVLNVDNQVMPGGTSKLDDFFDAIGTTIMSHVDEDVKNLDFSGVLPALKSIGYGIKALPSIIGFINSYGWTLTKGAMGGMEAQIPV